MIKRTGGSSMTNGIKKMTLMQDCLEELGFSISNSNIYVGNELAVDLKREKFRKHRRNSWLDKNYKKERKLKNYVKTNKQLGIISMEIFLSNYIGIDGELLQQSKNFTHDDLIKLGFKNIKRVPFDVVDGYGSQFFYVIDCKGYKLGYYNPKEILKIENPISKENKEVAATIKYNNKNYRGIEKNCYQSEDIEVEKDYDLFEEELNEMYNDESEIGEKKYGKYKGK